jgi:hypothetical protein
MVLVGHRHPPEMVGVLVLGRHPVVLVGRWRRWRKFTQISSK